MAHPLLFEPLTIGPVAAPNRIVFGAHFTRFTEPNPTIGEPGFYGARLARYLGERAAGGAGVVIAGQTAVHPTTAYQMPNNAAAWLPEAVPGFRTVTDAVHEHGSLAFIQLSHNGGVNGGDWSKLPVWAPSVMANFNEPPKALEQHEIDELVAHFAEIGAPRGRGRLRRHRDPRCARLPHPRVPVTEVEPPHRPLRRQPREPHALRHRGASGRS